MRLVLLESRIHLVRSILESVTAELSRKNVDMNMRDGLTSCFAVLFLLVAGCTLWMHLSIRRSRTVLQAA